MTKNFAKAALAALAMSASATAFAGDNVGMLIGANSVDALNSQEKAAAQYFEKAFPGGVIITPATLDKLNSSDLAAVWVHIDRCGNGKNVPAEFAGDALDALAEFVEDGGNVYLSKFATLMVSELGRIPAGYNPNIVGDGDGGEGFDDWTVNAFFGSWQLNPDNTEPDASQIYDRTSHAIYDGLTVLSKEQTGYMHPSFAMIGTGNPETSVWREDHNVCWDLNAVPAMDAAGKNTLEQFENKFSCTTLGTWGHVQDYCVAGIVEFAPVGAIKGKIVANGLAACEWAPRTGTNVYHSNLEKLTANTLNYLAPNATNGIAAVEANEAAEAVYFTIQGVKVAEPANGLFIKVQGGKASKVLVK